MTHQSPNLSHLLKTFVKAGFGAAGVDLMRASQNPVRTMLGLTSFPIKTIIDVGANDGEFARQALQIFPGSTIYSLEPLDAPFLALQAWAKREHRGVIVPIKVAAGE